MSVTNCLFMSLIINIHEHSVPNSLLDVYGSIWLGANTQSGIGYGDLVPRTHIGRAACVFLPLIGLFSMSTIVSNLEVLLIAKTNEKTAMAKIWDHFVVRKRLEDISVVLIQRRWRLHSNRVKRIFDVHVRLRYISHLLKFRRHFSVILNEEILLETMVTDLGSNFTEKYEPLVPFIAAANEIAQATEDLAHNELINYKRAVRMYHEVIKLAEFWRPRSSGRSSLCVLQTLSTRDHRRSTRKAKFIVTQRYASWQEMDSPEEPISGSLFRKRRR